MRDPGPVRTRAVTGREYHCGSPDFIALTVAKLYLQPELIRSPIGVMADTADDAYVHRDSGKVVPDECISNSLSPVRGLNTSSHL